jgi:hypothetical protein
MWASLRIIQCHFSDFMLLMIFSLRPLRQHDDRLMNEASAIFKCSICAVIGLWPANKNEGKMRLNGFQVTDFRSVEDSGWIEVQRLAALIGINESGKTNLLVPLWKLNPAREGEIQPTADYPKKLFGRIRANPGDYCFITAEFDTEELADKIAEATAISPSRLRRVRVQRFFDSTYNVEFPDAEPPRSVSAKRISELLQAGKEEISGLSALAKEEGLKEALVAAIEDIKNPLGQPLDATALNSLTGNYQVDVANPAMISR